MAQKYGIQYVNFYTDGSAARKIAPVRQTPKVVLPAPKKRKRKVVYVDPVAILGILVAVGLLIMMFAGLELLQKEQNKAEKMERYLSYLDEENEKLTQAYHSSYDREEIERTALALGMKYQDQTPNMVIRLPEAPEQEAPQKVTLLTHISAFLADWFA